MNNPLLIYYYETPYFLKWPFILLIDQWGVVFSVLPLSGHTSFHKTSFPYTKTRVNGYRQLLQCGFQLLNGSPPRRPYFISTSHFPIILKLFDYPLFYPKLLYVAQATTNCVVIWETEHEHKQTKQFIISQKSSGDEKMHEWFKPKG